MGKRAAVQGRPFALAHAYAACMRQGYISHLPNPHSFTVRRPPEMTGKLRLKRWVFFHMMRVQYAQLQEKVRLEISTKNVGNRKYSTYFFVGVEEKILIMRVMIK